MSCSSRLDHGTIQLFPWWNLIETIPKHPPFPHQGSFLNPPKPFGFWVFLGLEKSPVDMTCCFPRTRNHQWSNTVHQHFNSNEGLPHWISGRSRSELDSLQIARRCADVPGLRKTCRWLEERWPERSRNRNMALLKMAVPSLIPLDI